MVHLNQTRVNVRSTKPERVPLPEATDKELKQLRGKKEQDVYISVIDTWAMKNTTYQIRQANSLCDQEVAIDISW